MAQVRFHTPPARHVKRPNQRWDRQRPITRGGASTHGGVGGGTPATGATAGIPGTWTPPGSTPPSGPGAPMLGIVANPATAWTSGQFVQTQTAGAAGRVTWSGVDWVGGAAPLAVEGELYDPGDYTIDEVKAYVGENPDEKDDVLSAELMGKNRSTLVTWLESQ